MADCCFNLPLTALQDVIQTDAAINPGALGCWRMGGGLHAGLRQQGSRGKITSLGTLGGGLPLENLGDVLVAGVGASYVMQQVSPIDFPPAFSRQTLLMQTSCT